LYPWESLNVFNAAVAHHNGLFHMLYRAQGVDYVSRIGYAVSEDGFHWSRLDKPVLSPATEFEIRGVKDPRVTRIGDTFYMVYVGYSTHGTRVSLAASKNLIAWERLGIMLSDEDNKDAALFPEKIGGRYCLSHPWFQAVGWHLAGDPDATEVGDYAAWPAVEEWDWTYDDGTTARMRGHLRALGQIVNELVEAGFTLERLVEQNIEDVAKASPEELAGLPYLSKFEPASQEYQIMRKLPHTLIIRARKGASQHG